MDCIWIQHILWTQQLMIAGQVVIQTRRGKEDIGYKCKRIHEDIEDKKKDPRRGPEMTKLET